MRMSNFERAALEKLLAGEHPILARPRVQAEEARVASRDLTGSGFCLELDVLANIPQLPGPASDFRLDDVWARLDKLKWGAGLVLTVSAGRIGFERTPGYHVVTSVINCKYLQVFLAHS